MNKSKQLKTNIIYNSIGNFVFLFFQWLITILIVHFSGYEDAGILSLSMSFANSLYALASFGMRGYQSSDINYKFSNNIYIKSRLITCLFGFACFSIFIFLNDYNIYTKACIIMYLLFKSIEAFDDVYYGALQREWNMKYTGISYMLHGVAMIISFVIGLKFFNNLLYSIIIMVITSILITIFYDRKKYQKVCKTHNGNGKLKDLIIICLPLVIYAFLYNNIQVYPRYLLEKVTNENILGIYASIASPVLLIQVIAGFLFNPLLNIFTDYYNNKEKEKYQKLITKIYILIILLGILGYIYILFLGDFSLKLLFGKEILKYSNLLFSTLLVALLLSVIAFNNMILTIINKFSILIKQNLVSLLLSIILSNYFIIKYGIMGINISIIISLIISFLITLKDIYIYEKRERKLMKKIKKFLMNFGAKHSKFILRYVPNSIVQKIESSVVKNTNNFKRTTKIDSKLKNGINFVGHIKGQYGLGQGARLLVSALQKSKIKFNAIDVNMGNTNKHNDIEFNNILSKDFSYNINLFHVQPYTSFEIALEQINNTNNLEGRYNIGYWVYETENIPKKWESTYNYVNEIWTPSTFVTEAFKKVSPVPVYTIPYGIKVEKNEKLNRDYFGIPKDKFSYLIMYDPRSLAERKNPNAAIEAYLNAFKNKEEVCLVLVLNNADEHELSKLEDKLKEVKHYKLINKTLPKNELYSLISLCDVYVSLHRSEGFGLIMAEAMALGTVCIATNYSGNTEFMNNDNSCLVDYKMIEVDTKTQSVYEKGNKWADADVEQASKYMLKLYKNKKYYNKLKENAQKTIEKEFSITSCSKKIKKRINEIIKENDLDN